MEKNDVTRTSPTIDETPLSEDEWRGPVFDLLFEYSEWLDSDQHLVVGAGEIEEGDQRTHDDLVKQFMNDPARIRGQ